MKRALIILGVLAAAVVAYVLISPLFITKRVDERLEDIVPSPAVQPAPASAGDDTTRVEVKIEGGAAIVQPVAEPPPPPLAPSVTVIKQGSFSGLAGHNASGTARIVKVGDRTYVRFESDFSVTNGPDLFVGFGKEGTYVQQLAKLKGNVGGQNYEIPATLNVSDYSEVWVWCRAFSVPFGKAVLQ